MTQNLFQTFNLSVTNPNFWLVAAISAAIFTYALTGLWIQLALRIKILDSPNARSLHSKPTARGGGIAIVVIFTLFSVGLNLVPLTLILPSIAVAAIGMWDDISALPARVRLGIHILSGAIFKPLWAVPTAWMINLTNFMDGIDGILATQTFFFCVATSFITPLYEHALIMWILAGSVFGFYLWNFSPARVFLGDVGSGYLGFVIATLSLLHQDSVSVFTSLILYGVFIVDTGVTLVSRALQKLKLSEAHRSHAYQKMVQARLTHTRVTLILLGVNVCWLFPCAYLSHQFSNHAIALLIIAYAPLTLACIKLKAGHSTCAA